MPFDLQYGGGSLLWVVFSLNVSRTKFKLLPLPSCTANGKVILISFYFVLTRPTNMYLSYNLCLHLEYLQKYLPPTKILFNDGFAILKISLTLVY